MADTSTPTRRSFNFDPTINLGHILTASAFLVSTVFAYASLDARVTVVERDGKRGEERDAELSRAHRDLVVNAETRLLTKINDERARLDQTQVRTADDIREIKTIVRDGFRDLDAKLDRKTDKPGR